MTLMKGNALNSVMHTAGIYSDLTVDGPEIGTLVVIVDRAKNLPNRKSVGKQDPYCAARLGKEAKKTETDRRGGQTPKWDQELRFVVRDSPDYYQMKVSVFNDDKKTDLIGETWVNLSEVVIPGGGHNDGWHNLNCKGKYAGEIRMEITYYDSRPKQEKVSERMQQTSGTGVLDGQRDSMTGPRQPKPTPKRRPLPSDPTGASSSSSGTPEHANTPSRPHQPPPAHTPDYRPTPPRGYQTPPVHPPDHIHTPPRSYHSTPAQIYTQSPLQAVEFNTVIHNLPPVQQDAEYSSPAYSSSQMQQGYSQSRGDTSTYSNPSTVTPVHPIGRHIQDDRYETYDPSGRYQEPRNGGRRDPHEDYVEDRKGYSNLRYNLHEPSTELPAPIEYDAPPSPGGPPPPPPVHRSNHSSPAIPISTPHGVYELPQTNAIRNPAFRAQQQDAYRHSMPSYGHSSSYQSYSHQHEQDEEAQYQEHHNFREAAPRHHSYDGRYAETYRSMQPTVEDVPSSPAVPFSSSYRSDDPQQLYEGRRYEQVPPTAPLNLSSHGSTASGHHSASGSSQHFYEPPPSSISPLSYNENSHMGSEVSAQSSYSQHSQHSQYNQYGQQIQTQRRQGEDQTASPGGYVPSLPPSLVAGMDPMIAQEVSERIYTENRASYNQNTSNSSRSRHSDQPQYRQTYPHPHRQQEPTVPFVPASASSAASVPMVSSYDRQSRTYAPIIKPTAISPDPRVPPRKSVSPSPAPSPEGRRLSGVPFGPDAYDALNPNVGGASPAENQHSNSQSSMQTRPGLVNEVETPAKIILHDGREVDPSDHLPETSWAPEPEARGSKAQDNSRARALPNAGPRPLRQPVRPQSMAVPASSPNYPTSGFSESNTPAAASGRNRLQKKANRHSATVAAAPQSSPLAPVTTYQDNSFATRSLPRAQTVDFTGENGYASYNTPTKNGNYVAHGRNSIGSGPPVPAKVPISHGPPPLPPTENAWALLEEMKNIDLGSGRARRKNYHAVT